MNVARAENIIKYRTEIGPFQTREELKKVKAIGPKTFEQCAGFIRIDQTTAKIKGKSNILDSTWVLFTIIGNAHLFVLFIDYYRENIILIIFFPHLFDCLNHLIRNNSMIIFIFF